MRGVRFWGTRGSLPVALDAAGVRAKIVAALRGSAGRDLTSDEALATYVDGLPFAISGTFGGSTSCVQLMTGDADYVVCDLGSGLRAFGNAALEKMLAETRRFEEITRGTSPLRISAAYDGLEIAL
jgi:hypothetical protein